MRATLALDAALALALSVLYAYVGNLVLARRASSADAERALRSFGAWWYGLALVTAIGGLREIIAAAGMLERPPHAFLTYATLVPLVLALWGLFDYLVYVHTGSTRWRSAILLGHVALSAFLFGLVVYLHPLGATVSDWSAPIVFENGLEGPVLYVTLAALLGPVIAASLAYLGLAFRTSDRAARRRIFTVSGAFLLWFGTAALGAALGWDRTFWWPPTANAIALAATLVVLAAFRRVPSHAEASA